MTDLEMTRLCAEAMGLRVANAKSWDRYTKNADRCWCHLDRLHDGSMMEYDPLHDDAQAMALVKKFSLALWGHDELESTSREGDWNWHAEFQYWADDERPPIGHGKTANRAIVECVAKMQKERSTTA